MRARGTLERNVAMFMACKTGKSITAVAKDYAMARQSVSAIIKRMELNAYKME